MLERDIVSVFGMTGMGKTRWTRAFLRDKPRVIIMDPMVEHDGLLFDDLGALIDHVMHYRTFRVRVEFPDDFAMLCAIAYAARDCWLVIEETQRVLPQSRIEPPASFLDIVYRGRHRRVNLLMVSQRPSTVNIAARSQWSRLITFRQSEPADVAWFTNVTGFDLDPQSLPQSWYYDVTPGGYEKKILDDVRHHERISPPATDPRPDPESSQLEEGES